MHPGGRGTGRTVLLSSHILAEVEALCDRVSIIRAGRDGRDRDPGRPAPPDPHLDPGRARRAGDRLDALVGVHDLEVEDNRARFDVDTSRLDAALRHLTRSAYAA